MYNRRQVFSTRNNKIINVPVSCLIPTDNDWDIKELFCDDHRTYDPIVVTQSGHILDGHHRVKYAQHYGMECLPAVIVTSSFGWTADLEPCQSMELFDSISEAIEYADSEAC